MFPKKGPHASLFDLGPPQGESFKVYEFSTKAAQKVITSPGRKSFDSVDTVGHGVYFLACFAHHPVGAHLDHFRP